MARTTCSAKKATGAPAPRMNILSNRLTIKISKKQSAKKKPVTVTSPATSSTRSSAHTPDDNFKFDIKINMDILTDVLQVEVRGPVLENTDMDKDHDQWCASCQNGGVCYCCDYCLRVVCAKCITMPEDGPTFKCPFCHLHPEGAGRSKAPYDLKYVGNSMRESFLRCVSEPLAVISIILQGMPDEGPPKIVYEHLVPYLQGNACYAKVDFNFGTPKGCASFTTRLNALVKMFQAGQLKRFRRFMVFLTTHSDPERGDLHVMPDEQSSAPPDQIFRLMFDETDFGKLLEQSRDSVLTLVSCGAAVEFPEPRQALRNISSSKYFHQILAFTQANLQSAFVSRFLQDYALNRFIHLKTNISAYIYQHQILGAHTNIVLFEKAAVTKFLWSHDGQRPLGHLSPPQCPGCQALKPWTPARPKGGSTITHRCKNCTRVETYGPIPGTKEIRPPGPKRDGGDERGNWLTLEDIEWASM